MNIVEWLAGRGWVERLAVRHAASLVGVSDAAVCEALDEAVRDGLVEVRGGPHPWSRQAPEVRAVHGCSCCGHATHARVCGQQTDADPVCDCVGST